MYHPDLTRRPTHLAHLMERVKRAIFWEQKVQRLQRYTEATLARSRTPPVIRINRVPVTSKSVSGEDPLLEETVFYQVFVGLSRLAATEGLYQAETRVWKVGCIHANSNEHPTSVRVSSDPGGDWR